LSFVFLFTQNPVKFTSKFTAEFKG